MNGNVIILYGALRSGTTMVRLMLDAHSKVTCPGERDFMVGFFKEQNGQLVLDKEGLADARIFLDTDLTIPQEDDATAAFWDMVAQHNAGDQTLVLVVHRGLGELLRVFPQAKFVHLLRDPRDVARSSIGMGWVGNTYYGVDHWLGTERSWDQHGSKLPQDQVCLLKFEDLLEQPELHLRRVCDFMGLDYEDDMLNFDEGSTYSKVDPSLAYQWKRKQTAQELGELEAKIGDLMHTRDYALSGNTVALPTGFRALYLSAQNRYVRTMNRVRRYGLANTIQLKLATWFGLEGIRKRIRAERKDIDRANLK